MQIEVNNQPFQLSEGTTVSALAVQLELPPVGTALAVNNKMLPRTEWETHVLREHDRIVIIKAACGG